WLAAGRGKHVGFRIVGGIVGEARSYFEKDCFRCRAVLQAVAVGIAGLEARTVAGSEHLGSTICDKRHLARDNIDEFIGSSLPVTLARPAARWQTEKVDAELRKARGITQFGA